MTEQTLNCPICDFDHMHITHTEIEHADDYRNMIILHGECEDGCNFTITLKPHKGQTIIETRGERKPAA